MGADVQLPPRVARAHARRDLVLGRVFEPKQKVQVGGKKTGELETECRNGSDHVPSGASNVLGGIEF